MARVRLSFAAVGILAALAAAGCTSTALGPPAPQRVAAPAPAPKARPAAKPVAQVYTGTVNPGYRKRRVMREGIVSQREQSIPVAYEVVPAKPGDGFDGPGAGGWE